MVRLWTMDIDSELRCPHALRNVQARTEHDSHRHDLQNEHKSYVHYHAGMSISTSEPKDLLTVFAASIKSLRPECTVRNAQSSSRGAASFRMTAGVPSWISHVHGRTPIMPHTLPRSAVCKHDSASKDLDRACTCTRPYGGIHAVGARNESAPSLHIKPCLPRVASRQLQPWAAGC